MQLNIIKYNQIQSNTIKTYYFHYFVFINNFLTHITRFAYIFTFTFIIIMIMIIMILITFFNIH